MKASLVWGTRGKQKQTKPNKRPKEEEENCSLSLFFFKLHHVLEKLKESFESQLFLLFGILDEVGQ